MDGPTGDLAQVARLALRLAGSSRPTRSSGSGSSSRGGSSFERLWRSRPGPTLTLLQAALELSASPEPAELVEDLVATGGTTPFVERLRKVQAGEAATARDLLPVRRAAEALARGPLR